MQANESEQNSSTAKTPTTAEMTVASELPKATAGAETTAEVTPQTAENPALLAQLVQDLLREKIAERRWKYGFRIALLLLVVLIFFVPFSWFTGKNIVSKNSSMEHVAVVAIKGAIELEGPNSAAALNSAISAGFEDTSSLGVMLKLNSPGGSPVQSAMVFDEIMRLKAMYPKKKIIAVVEEICASGCYYIASAADEIHVNKASLVGSIGVIMDGFGAAELLRKLGVERRVLTAGENKAMLDPFTVQNPQHTAHIKQILKQVHQQFITAVKTGRGERLKTDAKIFSGLVFSGEDAVNLGLADGEHSLSSAAKAIFNTDELVDYTPQENITDKLAKRLGASLSDAIIKQLFTTQSAQSPQLR